MTQKQLDMITSFEQNLISIVGKEKAASIMEGFDLLTPRTNKVKMAQWVQKAIEKLDKLVPESQSSSVMHLCGENCAKINSRLVDSMKKKRSKFNSLDAFLQAEEQTPQKGTKLHREGSAIIQTYTPQEFTHPMRCFCGLVNWLPEKQMMSKTYCQCSKALVEKVWENVIGKSVKVELLETVLSSGKECRFKITL